MSQGLSVTKTTVPDVQSTQTHLSGLKRSRTVCVCQGSVYQASAFERLVNLVSNGYNEKPGEGETGGGTGGGMRKYLWLVLFL